MEGWLIVGRFGSVPGRFDYVAAPEEALVPDDLRRKRKAVLHAYRGVDGHPWFDKDEKKSPLLTDGLAAPADFGQVEDFYQRLPLTEPHKDLLYVQKIVRPLSITLPDGFVFLGFEFAEYESELGVHSSLYHEVFWGSEPAMHRFAKRLNAHLLCDSLADVAEMGAMRTLLLAKNPDLPTLETACTPRAMAIYGRPRSL